MERENGDMFYLEMIKIIEAGISGNSKMVRNYSILLSERLIQDGEEKFGKRIEALVREQNQAFGTLADGGAKRPEIVLSRAVEEGIKDFQNTIEMKDKLAAFGMPLNMSLLLYGPSGCGKASIASYLAGRLNLPLVTVQPAELVSELPGGTAKNLRRVFETAEQEPCVLFLDEFDVIAKERSAPYESGELKRAVNSLLRNIDTYCQKGILIAAASHKELLDDAVWRRFQTVIEVPKPGREEIQRLLGQITGTLDMSQITSKQYGIMLRQLEGMSYSEIHTLTQNVIKHMLLKNRTTAAAADFLCETAVFRRHGRAGRSEMIRYLSECGLSQRAIAQYYNISQRQVRNCLN